MLFGAGKMLDDVNCLKTLPITHFIIKRPCKQYICERTSAISAFVLRIDILQVILTYATVPNNIFQLNQIEGQYKYCSIKSQLGTKFHRANSRI